MQEQNFKNHAQLVPGYHVVLAGMLFLSLIGAAVNLVKSIGNHGNLYSAALLVVVFIALIMLYWYARVFALKAQDRAIRAEENLRHFAMTGKLLDARLTIRQVIALRFAADEEFPELVKRAAAENLSAKEIKTAIKHWRADYYRV
jgi:hypothetical protein